MNEDDHYLLQIVSTWDLTLLSYDFETEYTSTKSCGHAYVLSRLIDHSLKPDEELVIASDHLEKFVKCIIEAARSSLLAKMRAKETQMDSILRKT